MDRSLPGVAQAQRIDVAEFASVIQKDFESKIEPEFNKMIARVSAREQD